MKLSPDQLDVHLSTTLKPLYFLSGDEPLQLLEAADEIIAVAKKHGYTEREIWTVDSQFSWDTLIASTYQMSLFSSKQIIDLRLPGCKVGIAGAKALREYAERLPDDKVLLIRAGKLDAAARKSAWVRDISSAGVMLQFWDLSPPQTLGWVSKRMRAAGLKPNNEAVRLLTERVEGNLLAADQEIKKMVLLFADGQIDEQRVIQVVSDSSRFSVFDLSDAVLMGDQRRIAHILQVLKEEGEPVQLILWALSHVSRQLYDIAYKLESGDHINSALDRLPRQKQALFKSAISRLKQCNWPKLLAYNAELDRQLKGQGTLVWRDDSRLWDALFDYALRLSGYRKTNKKTERRMV